MLFVLDQHVSAHRTQGYRSDPCDLRGSVRDDGSAVAAEEDALGEVVLEGFGEEGEH